MAAVVASLDPTGDDHSVGGGGFTVKPSPLLACITKTSILFNIAEAKMSYWPAHSHDGAVHTSQQGWQGSSIINTFLRILVNVPPKDSP